MFHESQSSGGWQREGYAITKPDVRIEKHCWTKMHGWCKAASSEVSGMGLAKIENGVITVYDVFFPRQCGASGYTEMDDIAVDQLKYKLFKQKSDPTHFRFWWHTHYNFGVFWSGTDHENATRLARVANGWTLSLVINQAGHWKARFDQYAPYQILIDDLKVFLIPNTSKQKRKRNFKSDIARWVYPMEKNRNNPNPMTRAFAEPSTTPTVSNENTQMEQVYQDTKPVNSTVFVYDHTSSKSYYVQYQEWLKGDKKEEQAADSGKKWYEMWKKEEEETKPTTDEFVFDRTSHKDFQEQWDDFVAARKVIKEQKVAEEPKQEEKKEETKGTILGKKYTWSKEMNKIVTVEQAAIIQNCPCFHDGAWETCCCDKDCEVCTEKILQEGKQNGALH